MKLLRIAALCLVATWGMFTVAQTPPSGTYYAPLLELQFSFSPQPSGEIAGALIGGGGETPIHYVGDGVAYHGYFTVENMTFGVTVQLATANTLNIWLYEFDQTGTPIEASYEWYEAELMQGATEAAGRHPTELFGMWQAYGFVNDMQVSHVVYFDQSGAYEHGVYDVYGQLIYATMGMWQVEGDRLTQQITDYTPQICILGSCQPFHLPDAELVSSVPITFQNGGFTVIATSGQTLVYHAGVNMPAAAPPPAAMPNTGPMYGYPPAGGAYVPPAYGGGTVEFGGGFVGGGLSPPGENEHARWINTVIYENYELDDYY